MNMTRSIFLSAAAAVSALVCSCQQNVNYPVLFLTEADSANVEGARLNVVYNGTYYNRLPAMSLKHFAKFKSFMNPEDGSYGVRLFVKEEYRGKLFYTTLNNRGKLLLPVVGGLAYPPMMIDRGITDGEMDIRGGLNGYDLRMIGKQIEAVNPEIEEKRYLKENPRPLPTLTKEQLKELKDRHGRTMPTLPSYRSR